MKKPYMRIACLSLAALSGLALAQFQPPVTITPMTTFGGGDGNLTIAEADAMAAAHGLAAGSILSPLGQERTRGMAFNRATGNLIVVNRGTTAVPGNFINVLDGTTGGYLRRLPTTGMSGGAFLVNMPSVSEDGQVFIGNLQTAATPALWRLYRFANDLDTTTPATWVFNAAHGGPRVGDTLDVMGSGENVRVVAGYGTATGRGYLMLNQTGPAAFAATVADFGTAVAGDFRLGITWSHDGTRVLGTQGGPDDGGSYLHVTDPNATPPAHLGVGRLNWRLERIMDARFINGFHMLATACTTHAIVRIYHIDNALNPVFRASYTMFPNGAANVAGATGSIQWGAVNGKDATLYVMNTDNGIQAFNVEVVPEPATLLALGAGVAALVARRRRKK